MDTIRHSYTATQKLTIVRYSETMGVVGSAGKFKISHSMVSRWRKAKTPLMSVSKTTRKIGSGRKPMFPVQEEVLREYEQGRRAQGAAVTQTSLKHRMMQLVLNNGESCTQRPLKHRTVGSDAS